MKAELRDLYQEVILDHNKRPRNQGNLEHPTHQAEGHNPLCGDQILLELELANGKISAVKFSGHGCAISTASSSMMTEAVMGKTPEQAQELFLRVQEMLTTGKDSEALMIDYPELASLQGVQEFPVRVKCATLAWHTLAAALHGGKTASTE